MTTNVPMSKATDCSAPFNYEGRGRAVQIIDFDSENKLIFNKEVVQEILANHENTKRPLAVVSIVGPNRQGKSFFLSQVVNYLTSKSKVESDSIKISTGNFSDSKSTTEKNQIGEIVKEDMTGFPFRSGYARHTVGVWIWSTPLTIGSSSSSHNNEDEDLIDVILMDTQGVFDDFTGQREWSIIVGLSLMTSSCLIFNIMNDIKEDCLQNFASFLSHGLMMASQSHNQPLSTSQSLSDQPPSLSDDDDIDHEEGQGTPTPFQDLVFLVRDWQNPADFPFGREGGAAFIKEKLALSKPHQPETHQQIRHQLTHSFETIQCFLLPHPGPNIVKPRYFDGSHQSHLNIMTDLDPTFVSTMDNCITQLFNKNDDLWSTIPIKRFIGWPKSHPTTIRDFFTLLEFYVENCNNATDGGDNNNNRPESWYEVTVKIFRLSLVNKCVDEYRTQIFENIWIDNSDKCYFDDHLQAADQSARTRAFNLFDNESNKISHLLASAPSSFDMHGGLTQKIDVIFLNLKLKNSMRRQQFLIEAHREALREYRAVMKTNVCFIDFVSGPELQNYSDEAERKALSYFKLTCQLQGLKSTFTFNSNNSIISSSESMSQEIAKLLKGIASEKTEFEQANNLKILQAEKELLYAVQTKVAEYRGDIEREIEDKIEIMEEEEEELQNVHSDIESRVMSRFDFEERPKQLSSSSSTATASAATALFQEARKNLASQILQIFQSTRQKLALTHQNTRLTAEQIIQDSVQQYETFVRDFDGTNQKDFDKNHVQLTTTVTNQLERLFGQKEALKEEFVSKFMDQITQLKNEALNKLTERRAAQKKRKIVITVATAGMAGAGLAGLAVGGIFLLPALAAAGAGAAAASAIVPFGAATAAGVSLAVPAGAVAAGIGAGAAVGAGMGAGVGYKLAAKVNPNETQEGPAEQPLEGIGQHHVEQDDEESGQESTDESNHNDDERVINEDEDRQI